jgi:hypothetical protein
MTHSMHRLGSVESLSRDYIVFTLGDTFLSKLRSPLRRRFTGAYQKLEELLLKLGILKILRIFRSFKPKQIESPSGHFLLHSKEELRDCLKMLKEANTGRSVVVSGVFDDVNSILEELHLCPHTVQFSLGYFGNTKLLPRTEVLELTTMCGHHMVSPRLAEKLVDDVARGKATPKTAAKTMGRLCNCKIFNETRAAKMIEDSAK